ncbi:MAG: SpoIIE family protein phosphatase [Chloroflexi bacterium]|nr:SpoIIE family protein phosphatase [Chloroflexota bacterium]
MRIAAKLILGFGLLLALMAALGALVAYDMEGMQSDLLRLSDDEIPALRTRLYLVRDYAIDISQARSYLVGHEPWRLADSRSAALLIRAALRESEIDAPTDTGMLIRKVRDEFDDLHDEISKCEALAAAGKTPQAIAAWDRHVSGSTDDVARTFEDLRRAQEDHIISSAVGAIDHSRRLRAVSLVVVSLAFLVALVAVTLLGRSLLLPIKALSEAVETISDGDLSARAPAGQDDELGGLARNFNSMADLIADNIEELHTTQAALRERNEALSAAYRSVQEELELAARIQREILPREVSDLGMVAIADMTAASNVGGDFYDLLPGIRDSSMLQVVIGDVSGKGIAAALMMVFIVTTLRELCRREGSPAQVLHRLNRIMISRFGLTGEMYLTCVLGSLDRETLRFSFAKAGHEEPLWYRAALGRCESLPSPGLFVGLFSDGRFEDTVIQLEPLDRLVLFTDGIVEARSETGEQFGHRRMIDVVEASGSGTAAEMMSEIRMAVDNWSQGRMQRDDMTLVILEAPTRTEGRSADGAAGNGATGNGSAGAISAGNGPAVDITG